MEIINSFDLSTWQWAWIIISAFLVGFSKTGITGFMMPVIPIIASVFGVIVGNYINDKQFKMIISISVLVCLFTLIYTEKKVNVLKFQQIDGFML